MYQVIDIKKLKTTTDITNISNHNLRISDSNNVNKNKTHLNKYYIGRPDMDLTAELEKKLATVPKYRKDAVKLLNLVFSASPEFFNDRKKAKEWEEKTMLWVEQTFGKENILLSVVHNDEKTPHFHISIVPIWKGKLNASHWLDGPASLSKLHTEYNNTIKHLGLSRGRASEKPNHEELMEFYKKVNGSTEYEKKLDKNLDNLLEQIEKPTIREKLNPTLWVNNRIKPAIKQMGKNLSHYREKVKKVKELEKTVYQQEQRIIDLESKMEHMGFKPNISYAQCTMIKNKIDRWTSLEVKTELEKTAATGLLKMEGEDLEKNLSHEEKRKIKPR